MFERSNSDPEQRQQSVFALNCVGETLQEKGLLVNFYHQFVAAAKGDPTGYATLKQVLDENDMECVPEEVGEIRSWSPE